MAPSPDHERLSPKPFLGGWRDVARGLEYHDACSQTPLPRRPRLVSAQAQTTCPGVSRTTRSVVAGGLERAVQAGEPFPLIGEVLLAATEPRELQRRQVAAVKIQRFYR